jgi:hypothetical protein
MRWPAIRWKVIKEGDRFVRLAGPEGVELKVEQVARDGRGYVVIMAMLGESNTLPARTALELNQRLVAGALFTERGVLGMRRVVAAEANVAAAVDELADEAARFRRASRATPVACSPQPMFEMWLA